jgi:murein DD-endopeptidase MepM/ murein hydrolase activator NlpD
MQFPIDMYREHYITSGYGMRIHPILRRAVFHGGIDIAARRGTKIYSACGGVVVSVKHSGLYGRTIIVRHSDVLTTVYSHLGAYNVWRGKKVKQGELLGWMGRSGRVTGVHLHFEVRVNGKHVNPFVFLN